MVPVWVKDNGAYSGFMTMATLVIDRVIDNGACTNKNNGDISTDESKTTWCRFGDEHHDAG